MIKADKREIKNKMIQLGEEDFSIVITHFRENINHDISETLIKDIHDIYVEEKKDRDRINYLDYQSRLDR